MRLLGRWRDKRAARKYHETRHVRSIPNDGRHQFTVEGCPFCAEAVQWWADLRAQQSRWRATEKARSNELAEAYKRHVGAN